MGWLSNFFKSPNDIEAPSYSTGFHDLDGSPVPIKPVPAQLRAARELINDAAIKTVQAYGVPAHWLSFEVVTISDEEKAYFQLQVLINHWDEFLMAHTHAFERAVVKLIREDNVEVGRAVRAVLWRLAAEAGCPYDDMPEPQAWSAEEVKKRGEARDLVNRALYAATTPASGAVAPNLQSPATMPVSADDAERAGRSTMPVKFNNLLDDDGFSDTSPNVEHGFAATQPFSNEAVKNTR